MIPKIIHYCWFGGNPLPELEQRCIQSWKQLLPDYELKLWNESNFDLNLNQYVRDAYDSKKYAFVTDYVRLFALYNFGGIYMDTDVEVIQNFDEFLSLEGFSGFESIDYVPTGVIAAKAKHPFILELLNEYANRNFYVNKNKLNLTTNVVYITNAALKHGLIQNGEQQTVANVTYYPSDFFCARNLVDGKIEITKNTYCVHHHSGSWVNKKQKQLYDFRNMVLTPIKKVIGINNYLKVKRLFKG